METKKVYVVFWMFEMYNGAVGEDFLIADSLETAKKIFSDKRDNYLLSMIKDDGYNEDEIAKGITKNEDMSFTFSLYDDYMSASIEEREILSSY